MMHQNLSFVISTELNENPRPCSCDQSQPLFDAFKIRSGWLSTFEGVELRESRSLKRQKWLIKTIIVFVFILAGDHLWAQTPGAIAEPGLIMFGAISNSTGGFSATATNVLWQISSTSASLAVNPATINFNGQNFYVATVPFETRSIGGVPIGPATHNTLPLNSTPTTYARLAAVNGTNATIVYASSGSTNTFTFGPADRGRIERVDLAVSPPQTFAQWLAQYGLPANSDPNSDPTHKGMPLMQQFIAGLNPNDPNSVFKILGIQPTAQGVQILWSSVAGKTYTIQQANSLKSIFSPVQSNIVATPDTNAFTIPMPTNSTALFLRVLVNQ